MPLELANKWEQDWIVRRYLFRDRVERNNMSLILENQAKQLVVESSLNRSRSASNGASSPGGVGEQWAGIALPLVRKVFGMIAAKDFVSVQPMSLPSGLVFFLDFQYGGGGAKSGSAFNVGGNVFGTGSMYGVTNTSTSPTDGTYGAGKWTYSSAMTSSAGAGATFASASWSAVGYDAALSASIGAAGTLKVITVAATAFDNPDLNGVRGFVVEGTAVGVNTPQYNFTNAAKTEIYLFTEGTKGVDPSGLTISYPQQTTAAERGDFEQGNTSLNLNNNPIDIPEINIKMKSEAIVAKTKKLKAVWTPEFAQDLNAYHSLDAEAELTSIMSEYIALEIDLEILGMLLENALTTDYWSAVNNQAFDGSGDTPISNGTFYNTQGQWFQTLGTKLNKVSNKIHQLTLRGGANFMVCSPTIGTILESIPGFAASDGADADSMKYAFGIQKVGNLNSKYEVYKNPYMTENAILLGFKGSQFLETGATFAPYIPLIMTPLVYDPNTFTPRKGLLTRYAKKMLRPEYYAKIMVAGLNTL
jgi:hypothetical protein